MNIPNFLTILRLFFPVFLCFIVFLELNLPIEKLLIWLNMYFSGGFEFVIIFANARCFYAFCLFSKLEKINRYD